LRLKIIYLRLFFYQIETTDKIKRLIRQTFRLDTPGTIFLFGFNDINKVTPRIATPRFAAEGRKWPLNFLNSGATFPEQKGTDNGSQMSESVSRAFTHFEVKFELPEPQRQIQSGIGRW